MEYEYDDIFNFETFTPYFDVHVAGLEGECFSYTVYFEEGVSENTLNDAVEVINQWIDQFNFDDYPGDVCASVNENRVLIDIDLGNAHNCDRTLYGIIEALNNTIKGIKSIIVNEGM